MLTLAGGPENFSDQTILGQGDRDQQEALRGVWLYEIADLSHIGKAEVEAVKAFASRTHDRARPAYGRFRMDLPRRGTIWATTNNSEYLKGQTGNRRFWPVAVAQVRPIDIPALKHDRDQLFAEACDLDATGASIVLPKALWAAAGEQQELRREVDPWEDILRNALAHRLDGRVLTQTLLVSYLGIPTERQTDTNLKRVSACMRLLGWTKKLVRVGDQVGRGYIRTGPSVTGSAPV